MCYHFKSVFISLPPISFIWLLKEHDTLYSYTDSEFTSCFHLDHQVWPTILEEQVQMT